MDARTAIGRFGEDLVARRLTVDGWEVLARNWRCPDGEIDLIAREGACLVIVEVKTKPPEWRGLAVPDVLRSGDHAAIARWRRERAVERTAERRPELIADHDPAADRP